MVAPRRYLAPTNPRPHSTKPPAYPTGAFTTFDDGAVAYVAGWRCAGYRGTSSGAEDRGCEWDLRPLCLSSEEKREALAKLAALTREVTK
jgi:hypothetical protein